MNLSSPIRSVIPSVHGAVLAALATADEPISGRALAARIEGQAGYRRVNQVLQALVQAGVARCESRPPARLYELNRDHVAVPAILQLADLRRLLLDEMRAAVMRWAAPPTAVWVSGSAARTAAGTGIAGHADDAGHIDGGHIDGGHIDGGHIDGGNEIVVLAFRQDGVAEDDAAWQRQLAELSRSVTAWSGNRCHVLDYSQAELDALADADEETIERLRADTVTLYGVSVRLATTGSSRRPTDLSPGSRAG